MQHKMVLTIKQRVFIAECYAKHNSWKRCAELFAQEFQTGRVLVEAPAKTAMQNLVAKWRETDSVANKYPLCNPYSPDVKDVPSRYQLELLNLQCDDFLKDKYKHNKGLVDFNRNFYQARFLRLYAFAAQMRESAKRCNGVGPVGTDENTRCSFQFVYLGNMCDILRVSVGRPRLMEFILNGSSNEKETIQCLALMPSMREMWNVFVLRVVCKGKCLATIQKNSWNRRLGRIVKSLTIQKNSWNRRLRRIVNESCTIFTGSRIYRLRGYDPDNDTLTFGLQHQADNEILRIENLGTTEADVYLKKELDREV
ncbi:hypothetical protein ANN_14121 [Periplaneta americana]|uniref:DUF4817 domain-containing protein n=1 Tax=Periplaneta americana TaxID=6978 RepID=A0ABQ8SWY8_PERAM|nr:hypothetical protein ANN_14121 [Periplaneta americana]